MLTNHISFRISINAIEIKITDIFPKFGHFNMSFEKFTVDVLRNGNIQGSLLSANMYREFNGNIDKFIYEFTGDDKRQSKYPLVVFSYKKFDKTNTLDVYAWNFMVEYYTIWLQLIENEVHEQPPVEAVLEVLPESTPSSNVSVLRKLDVKFNLHDCSIGLSPGRLNCKGFVCIERGTADLTIGENQLYIKSSFRDISVLLIDDIKNITTAGRVTDSLPHGYRSPVAWFSSVGCLNIGYINVTHVGVTVTSNVEAIKARNERLKIKDKLSVLELKINLDEHTINVCADSTHTLVQLINDLKEPIVFLDEEKFKVQLLDKVDLLEEIGNIFGESTNSSRSDDNTPKLRESMGSLNILDEYIPESGGDSFEQDMANLNISNSVLNDSNLTSIDEEHFTMEDRHNHGNRVAIPVLMFINASKIHIRLFDGYDWDETRQVIKGAVKRVETQAVEEMSSSSPFKANSKARVQFEDDMDDSDVAPPLIGETLYQSIHLSIPAGVNPSLLTRNINKNVQSEEKEDPLDVNYKNLKLKRSQFHKLAIEVSNLEVIVSVFTTRDPRDTSIDVSGLPESEIVNQVDLKVENFEILDKVPTSTWHKFVGYLRTAGERELLTKSFKLSLQNVRPNSNLCATEAIIDVSILPLRLYVDQDTLDFITRFGEFKDSRFELPIDDILYIQKFKISSLKIKLDYKPKKIDYAGIGSGHTAEFINFFILDGAEILLKKVTLYGLLGFPKLALELKNVWAPDVQSTQLIGVLAGLAPIRSIVNIGTGVKDLVAIPISEYKKDGRLMRSLQKGAFLFAKTTSAELLKLGVKLAAGTQVLLEQGEEAFGGEGSSARLPSGVSKKVKTQKGLGRKETYVEVDVDDEEDDEDYDDFDNESYIRSNSPLVYAIAERKSIENDLMASSQLLNQSLQMENNHQNRHNYGSSRKLYSFAEIDDSTIDSKLLRKTFATKAPKPNNTNNNNTSAAVNDSLVKDDETQKAVSLYSNQPIGAQEGLQLAYNSIGRNFKSTKVAVIRTRDAMIDAGSVPEAAVAMAKGAPVILIRPIIGATEVVQKTLLGLTNQIDPNQKLESEEKYKPM